MRENPAALFRGQDPAPFISSKAVGQQKGMESLPCAMTTRL